MTGQKRPLAAILFALGLLVSAFCFAGPSSATPGYSNQTVAGVSDQSPCTGCSLTVSGSGFKAFEAVNIRLVVGSNSYFLGSVTTNASGSYSTTVTLPAGVTGSATVVSTGAKSGHVATAALTVASSSGSSGTGGSSGGGLPNTGVAVLSIGGIGLLLLVGGGTLLIAGRHRRTAA